VFPQPPPATHPALLPGKAALRLIITGPTRGPVASRTLRRRRPILPRVARRATRGMKKRVAALPPAHPTAMMMNSGIPAKAAAFRTADRPIRPVLLPVQSVHRLDGTGVPTRNAASLTTPTLLLRNAPLGGYGTVGSTSASQTQPLHLLKPLNLLTIMAMAGRSDLRSFVPIHSRSPVLGRRWTRSLHT